MDCGKAIAAKRHKKEATSNEMNVLAPGVDGEGRNGKKAKKGLSKSFGSYRFLIWNYAMSRQAFEI
jgi:hypothetical protein